MWIRSENRKLLTNVNSIYIERLNSNYAIFECEKNVLGTYKSEKRCIKILDDIQEKMFNCDKNYVYEMPSV